MEVAIGLLYSFQTDEAPIWQRQHYLLVLCVHLCQRYSCDDIVCRAVSLLEMFKLEKWEKEVAYSMVSQSVAKLSEKFSFTSYKKIRLNLKDTSQQD